MNLKLIIAGVILLTGISIGYGLSDMIHVKPLKAEVKAKDAEISKISAYLASTIDINANNDKLFESERTKHKQAIKSCQGRIVYKEKTCNEVINILTLTGGGKPDETNPDSSSGDAVLDMLNSMWR